jgi:hypothetical protein
MMAMEFKPAPDHIENQMFSRKISENGIWEIGIYPVAYGYRVRAGIVGNGWVTIDYCAASQQTFLGQLYAVVQGILETFPESTPEHEIERLMPRFERKPINQDPCWNKLNQLLAERVSR